MRTPAYGNFPAEAGRGCATHDCVAIIGRRGRVGGKNFLLLDLHDTAIKRVPSMRGHTWDGKRDNRAWALFPARLRYRG